MGKTVHVFGFPTTIYVEAVKLYLEDITGEGTVYAIKLRQSNKCTRAYAIVQFTTVEFAQRIFSLANNIEPLRYGASFLKVREMANDIVPKPRVFLHSMEKVTLYFGCQISNEKFSVLWKTNNVHIGFEFGMRKLHFFCSHALVEYKLQLSYENIWQFELRCPSDVTVKHLLIQLLGAPRIYKKDGWPLGDICENPLFNFFKDIPDQWFRETDFTESCFIGQSSAICLKLPKDVKLPNFKENFAYYKESEGRFVLQNGYSFSRNPVLVPIVGPPPGLDLPYEILFKINVLVQNGCLPGPTLDHKFYRLVDPSKTNSSWIENALEKLYRLKECCYEPSEWLSEQYGKYRKSRYHVKPPAISLDDGLVYVCRIQITPCKVYFCGPEINVSNRVLRHYSGDIDNFLRVSFVDEELDKVHSTDLLRRTSSVDRNKVTGIYHRIFSTLRNGIQIGTKKFEFLAFSSSQLRENSAWMFAARNGLNAADIREWMGDFLEIRNVAKYAARLGQSFSSSTESSSVAKHEMEIIEDIEVEFNGTNYVFSDGIGKISSKFAKEVAKKCGFNKGLVPSAFQIRYGGYKGVVAVDPTSLKKLSLRKSMSKYDSKNIKLDVLSYSKFQPCFLNRQLITLLSTLGVGDHIFEKKQREAVDQLDGILTDPLKAHEALVSMSSGEITNILMEMLSCGYRPDTEPFLAMMLQTFRKAKLLELQTKTRIFLPKGRSMMGCLDETKTLEYGEVFVQFSSPGRGSNQCSLVVGTVVVSKNPCLHPGDVRVLTAVNVPKLHHMVDCVVFPQKGIRPHPNECSGSDLDGDIYFVSWDKELIPPRPDVPMDYTPAPPALLDHEVTIEEVKRYFVDYILNDSLGIIANAHTVFADKEPLKARSAPCIELAKLFSIAVDFPKTGIPAVIPQQLYVREYPDFMEKPDKPTYVSHNVIGKLFRAVKCKESQTSSINSFSQEVVRESYDVDMEVDGFEDYIAGAFHYKSNYDFKLGNLMDYYGIKTEAEILSGNIMRMSKSFTKRRDAEAITMAIRSLRKEARTWFNEKEGGSDDECHDDDIYAKASAWYYVTYHPTYWGSYNEGLNRDHFLSFPWCVYDKLIMIKKAKLKQR